MYTHHETVVVDNMSSSINRGIEDGDEREDSHIPQPVKFSSVPPVVKQPPYQPMNPGSGYQSQGVAMNRPSVLNHSVELDDILEESDCFDDEEVESKKL